MVRRHERLPCAGELQAGDLDVALIVDVIEVQDREKPGIGPPPAQVRAEVDACRRSTAGSSRARASTR